MARTEGRKRWRKTILQSERRTGVYVHFVREGENIYGGVTRESAVRDVRIENVKPICHAELVSASLPGHCQTLKQVQGDE